MEALHFGPGDFSASVGIPTTTIGGSPEGYPGDHLNHVYLAHRRRGARGRASRRSTGPYGDLATRRASAPARAWPAPSASTASGRSTRPRSRPSTRSSRRPTQELERAEALLAAYREAIDGEGRGAARFEGEMVDEASRKMAERVVRAGRAAGAFRPRGLGGWLMPEGHRDATGDGA